MQLSRWQETQGAEDSHNIVSVCLTYNCVKSFVFYAAGVSPWGW
jgi:hypothetical protein